jgi:small-conductance mechanosensitive channel
MNFEKVVFAFFVLLAAALNVSFVWGDADNYLHHPAYELFAALVVNLIATVLKLGDRTHLGAVLLATSLVADLLLIGAAATWGYYSQVLGDAASPEAIIAVVSPAAGALFANVASVVLLVAETINLRR